MLEKLAIPKTDLKQTHNIFILLLLLYNKSITDAIEQE